MAATARALTRLLAPRGRTRLARPVRLADYTFCRSYHAAPHRTHSFGSIRSLAAGAAAAACASTLTFTQEAPTEAAVEPIVTENIRLADGRRLAYRCLGDPAGLPVFALHGMGSSHCTFLTDMPLTELLPGVLLIAVDRPGYGDSDNPPSGYSYTAFARDIGELATALGHDKFSVCGHSSGGPYALAVAALLPERVLSCAAISSDPPYNHPSIPDAVRKSDTMSAAGKEGFYGIDPVEQVAKWRESTLRKPHPYLHQKRHAWKRGELGFVCDFTLERLPWSFRIEDISLGPRLSFWVGGADYPPMILGTPWMQSLVPGGAKLFVVEGGDHGFKSEAVHLRAILLELRDAAMGVSRS